MSCNNNIRELQQQYPGYHVIVVPEELHDHVFEAVQSHIDTKKQEHEKKTEEKRATQQHATRTRNADLKEAATAEETERAENTRGMLKENDTLSDTLRNLLNALQRRGMNQHTREANKRYEKLQERIIEAKELARQIVKDQVEVDELKRAETKIAALNNDLRREEAKLQSLLQMS